MAEPAWDRGEGEDGEPVVFVETVSTARRGRALLFASALFGGLMLGAGLVGAVWGGVKLFGTYEEFQRQTRLVQQVDQDARDNALEQAARLDEQDYIAAREYWRLRARHRELCQQARSRGRGGECLERERDWNDPPPLPEGVPSRQRDQMTASRN